MNLLCYTLNDRYEETHIFEIQKQIIKSSKLSNANNGPDANLQMHEYHTTCSRAYSYLIPDTTLRMEGQ